MLEDEYETTFRSHAATLLRAAAWLAGSSLQRSFPPGGSMPADGSERAEQPNEELKLMKVFMFLVDKNGIQLKPEDYALKIPGELSPEMGLEQVEKHFGKRYDEIMKKHGFDGAGGARTGAVVSRGWSNCTVRTAKTWCRAWPPVLCR